MRDPQVGDIVRATRTRGSRPRRVERVTDDWVYTSSVAGQARTARYRFWSAYELVNPEQEGPR